MKKIACMITTDKRGVFMGLINPDDADKKIIRAEEVRMCVKWSDDVQGVVSLCDKGPTKNCRITGAAPAATLEGVTAVFEMTDKALAAWRKEPWA